MPAAETDIPADLVRRLIADQHPDLAGRPVEVLANGWDNLICRLGADLAVRLPRRAASAELIRHEQRWLPGLAPRLPLAIPAPVRTGRPALGYAWHWSIVPLLPGQIAAISPPADPAGAAASLGRFLGALHAPAPAQAPANPFRGVPLADRNAAFESRLARLTPEVDAAAARRTWAEALAAPRWHGPPLWLHGDLHPANILVDRGRISGVIDFGDITSGDPATDLSVAWAMLPARSHAAFRAAYHAAGGPPAAGALWARARGWAVGLAIAILASSADNPLMAGLARRTLAAAVASPVPGGTPPADRPAG
jgi:aminoglycoside phosphotransferase (APT) family kinase protein